MINTKLLAALLATTWLAVSGYEHAAQASLLPLATGIQGLTNAVFDLLPTDYDWLMYYLDIGRLIADAISTGKVGIALYRSLKHLRAWLHNKWPIGPAAD